MCIIINLHAPYTFRDIITPVATRACRCHRVACAAPRAHKQKAPKERGVPSVPGVNARRVLLFACAPRFIADTSIQFRMRRGRHSYSGTRNAATIYLQPLYRVAKMRLFTYALNSRALCGLCVTHIQLLREFRDMLL